MSDRTPPPFLVTLAEFAAHTRLEDISTAARERARWVTADCIPVIAAGACFTLAGAIERGDLGSTIGEADAQPSR